MTPIETAKAALRKLLDLDAAVPGNSEFSRGASATSAATPGCAGDNNGD